MSKRELSRYRKQILRRLRRGNNPERDLPMLMAAGYKPVSEWDDEELSKGRPRNSRGSICGRAPSWLTGQIEAEALRRLKEATLSALKPRPEVLSQVLLALATNPETPADLLAMLDAALTTAKQRIGPEQDPQPPVRLKDPDIPPELVDDEDRMPQYLYDAHDEGRVF
ncbi:hypothetical protein OG598_24960 [Micromonospora sp. NBC_00330]|uniref:hypothetical protein n=1 Tax=Micromonospora sp. NBC_00330 TaxID=2903585 RepID=UPI002E294861|nr:hypothetical protein [Micromonospora sp. NBC_00330]